MSERPNPPRCAWINAYLTALPREVRRRYSWDDPLLAQQLGLAPEAAGSRFPPRQYHKPLWQYQKPLCSTNNHWKSHRAPHSTLSPPP
jgi:hypothetical protein